MFRIDKGENMSPVPTSVSRLLAAFADQLPEPQGPAQGPAWGNADVLVQQWRTELGDKASEAMLLGIRIRRIAMMIDRLLIEQCTAHGIKYSEFLLLMALRRIGEPYELRPSDILRMHSVTSGTATYRIDRLTTQGLAERMNDPKDRRSYLIRLTAEGKKMVEAILAHTDEFYRKALVPLTDIDGGLEVLEGGLRLFEACIAPRDR